MRFLATETFEGRVALPELLEDLAGQGISSVMVEGGADTARAFLEDGLVDRIVLFRGDAEIGADGIASPIDETQIPAGFALKRDETFGNDRCLEWMRGMYEKMFTGIVTDIGTVASVRPLDQGARVSDRHGL